MPNLFLIALAIACVAWTVTQEEVFREPRELCVNRSQNHPKWYCRKFFYLFTCHYCFSHYVTAAAVYFTGFKLVTTDFSGNVIGFFALVFIANVYMSLYRLLRLAIKLSELKAKRIEMELKK